MGISQALLLLYRYLTGIYALGDLSFVQFLAGYVCGKGRSLDGCRILTVSGNGTMHGFRTRTGMILEEISTTHIKGDSLYEDETIPSDPTARKTPAVL